MKTIRVCFILVPLLLSVGCASPYKVTYEASPEGAVLVCHEKLRGTLPKTLIHAVNSDKQNSLDLSDCSAVWKNGAQASYAAVDISNQPRKIIVDIARPDVPGAEIDAAYAAEFRAERWRGVNQSAPPAIPIWTQR